MTNLFVMPMTDEEHLMPNPGLPKLKWPKLKWQRRWQVLAFGFDSVALVGALGGAALVRFGVAGAIERIRPQSIDPSELFRVPWLSLVPIWLLVAVINRLYNPALIRNVVEEGRRVVTTCLGASVALIIASFASQTELSRHWLITATALAIPLMLTSRQFLRVVVTRQRRRGKWLSRGVVVGGNAAANLVDTLTRDTSAGFELVGTAGFASDNLPSSEIGGVANLIAVTNAVAVIVVAHDLSQSQTDDVIAISDGLAVDVLVLPGLNYSLVHSLSVVGVGSHPALFLETPGLRIWQKAAKRGFDLLLGVIACLILSPIFLLSALAIWSSSGAPIFFQQLRIGHDGRSFRLIKFRTMIRGADTLEASALKHLNETDGLLFKSSKDPRITKVGRFLRKFSLDELPQLFNVLRGEMSLVGPRPALPSEVSLYSDLLLRRLQVKPGLTGLWQVSGRSDLPFEEYVRLDLTYVRNWSLMLDLYILARTIPAVLFGRGAH